MLNHHSNKISPHQGRSSDQQSYIYHLSTFFCLVLVTILQKEKKTSKNKVQPYWLSPLY